MAKRRDTITPDMFDEYQPPKDVVPVFDPLRVRGKHMQARIKSGVAETLRDTKMDRPETVEAINDILGKDFPQQLTVPMLNQYAAESSEDHVPSILRLWALSKVTDDKRLLNLIAEDCGWIVIDKRYKPAIDEAMIAAEIEERRKQIERLEHDKKTARNGWKK